MRLKCKSCLNIWNYHPRTKGNFYATCTKCLRKVNIKQQRVDDNGSYSNAKRKD